MPLLPLSQPPTFFLYELFQGVYATVILRHLPPYLWELYTFPDLMEKGSHTKTYFAKFVFL